MPATGHAVSASIFKICFYVFCLEHTWGLCLMHFQTDYKNPALVQSNPMTLSKLLIFKVTNDQVLNSIGSPHVETMGEMFHF